MNNSLEHTIENKYGITNNDHINNLFKELSAYSVEHNFVFALKLDNKTEKYNNINLIYPEFENNFINFCNEYS